MGRIKPESEMTFEDMISRQVKLKGHENLAKAHKNADLNYKLDQSFPEQPLTSDEHSHSFWGGYNDVLFDQAIAHKNLSPKVRGGTTSKFIQVVGFHGRNDKSILKAPLDWKDLKLHHMAEDPNTYSHLLHRKFNTAHREAAFHDIAKHVFAMDKFVPATTVFVHPRTGHDWSAQRYVHNASPFLHDEQLDAHPDEDYHKLAIMEAILGHNDRNKSNVLFDQNGHMKLIDNALTFDYSHRYGTPVPSYAKKFLTQEVPSGVHRWLDSISGHELATRLSDMGAPTNIVNGAASRLLHMKDWSKAVRQNKHFTQDLGSGLELARSHRLGAQVYNDKDLETVKNAAWNRIEQGVPYVPEPSEDDDTAIVGGTKKGEQ